MYSHCDSDSHISAAIRLTCSLLRKRATTALLKQSNYSPVFQESVVVLVMKLEDVHTAKLHMVFVHPEHEMTQSSLESAKMSYSSTIT